MPPGNTIIKYSDIHQSVTMNDSSQFTATNITSFGDTDSLLEPGEIFEVALLNMDDQLATGLGVSQEFIIEVIPPNGAVLFIGRRLPVSLDKSNNLH